MWKWKLTFAGVLGPVVGALAILSMGQIPALTPNFGDPLPGVTADELAAFNLGKGAFEQVEGVADGLGPVFNDNACAACHNVGATGGGSTRLETRFGRTVNGVFDPLANEGGSLMQDHGIGLFNGVNFVAEVVPADANTVARRRTTPLFGLGLVENVPDDTLIALQQQTGGRANTVFDIATGVTRVGRFGWKCQQATLLAFPADAYLNEMGITTPRFPASGLGFNNESCPQGNCALLAANPGPVNGPDGTDDGDFDDIEAFTNFMTFLGAPPRGAITSDVQQGATVFNQIGCAVCHVPSLTTGDSTSAALNHVTFFPYSDFLLHDMGSMNDGIEQGTAGAREMRTAPLWGLRLLTTFLHDGRASNIPQAILAHDGQAAASRGAFSALKETQKNKLMAFLKSL
jgi:CxxC motif-containing protein (DUF1111 family)